MAARYTDFWPIYRTTLYLRDWLGYLIVVGVTFGFGMLAALPGIRHVNRMDLANIVAGGQFG